jgi:hypothetical protein
MGGLVGWLACRVISWVGSIGCACGFPALSGRTSSTYPLSASCINSPASGLLFPFGTLSFVPLAWLRRGVCLMAMCWLGGLRIRCPCNRAPPASNKTEKRGNDKGPVKSQISTKPNVPTTGMVAVRRASSPSRPVARLCSMPRFMALFAPISI